MLTLVGYKMKLEEIKIQIEEYPPNQDFHLWMKEHFPDAQKTPRVPLWVHNEYSIILVTDKSAFATCFKAHKESERKTGLVISEKKMDESLEKLIIEEGLEYVFIEDDEAFEFLVDEGDQDELEEDLDEIYRVSLGGVKQKRAKREINIPIIAGGVFVVMLAVVGYFFFLGDSRDPVEVVSEEIEATTTTTTTTTPPALTNLIGFNFAFSDEPDFLDSSCQIIEGVDYPEINFDVVLGDEIIPHNDFISSNFNQRVVGDSLQCVGYFKIELSEATDSLLSIVYKGKVVASSVPINLTASLETEVKTIQQLILI